MAPVTISKSAVSGTKRKSAPAKDVNVKESKKAKIELGKKGKESKIKAKPVKKVESESEEESESEDGGAALEAESADGSDSDTEMKEVEGIHPDRIKAVAANSKGFLDYYLQFGIDRLQVNHQKRHMRNRSNWQMRERPRSL